MLLTWTQGDETIALELDVATTETYGATAEVTEHPVETGSAAGDHIRPAADTFTIEGMVSNTPIRVPSTQMRGATRSTQTLDLRVGDEVLRVAVAQWSSTFDRVRDCHAIFAALVRAGVTVALESTFGTDDNLVLISYRVPRTADTSGALPVTLDFKRLRRVSTARAPVPAIRRAQVPQQRGPQPAVPNSGAGLRFAQSIGVAS
jgi:hypothetical protein